MLNYANLNLNQSGQYGQIYAEKFTSASLICKVFYGKMKAQWGKYDLRTAWSDINIGEILNRQPTKT